MIFELTSVKQLEIENEVDFIALLHLMSIPDSIVSTKLHYDFIVIALHIVSQCDRIRFQQTN